jgi:isoleucyl-tRNA synthetase
MGKAMKKVAGQIAAFSHEQVKALLDSGEIQMSEGVLTLKDVIIVREVKAGQAVEAGENLTVALDTILTPELLSEGISRECVNKIQSLRKDAGFSVTDKITLKIFTESADIRKSIENHKEYIQTEVLAESLEMLEKHSGSGKNVELAGQPVVFFAERL